MRVAGLVLILAAGILAGCPERPAETTPTAPAPAGGADAGAPALVPSSPADTSDMPQVGATSQCGKYRLWVTRTWQRSDGSVSIDMVIHVLDAPTGNLAPKRRQSGVFCGGPSEVIRAVGGEGKDSTGGADHHCWWDYFRPDYTLLDVGGLKFDRPQDSLRQLDLSLHVYITSKWKTLEFPGLGKGESKPMLCGPLEIITEGDERSFLVTVVHASKYSKEHKEFEEATGLRYLTYTYAFGRMQITDAAGEPLWATTIDFSGGGGVGTYIISDPTISPSESFVKGKPIKYPVRIQLEIPQAGHTGKAEFTFRDIPLPKAERGKRTMVLFNTPTGWY